MTSLTLILRSLRYYARSHLAVLLGAAIGSAVLIGALVVGDSVRASLRQFALARLGRVQLALASNDRFFRAAIAKDLEGPLDTLVAATLQLPGTATAADGSARANRVQVLGVEDRFWAASPQAPAFATPAPEEVVLNQRLADQLKVKAGDAVVLRLPKPSQISRDAPISPQENASVALRLTVRAIASDAELGRFSLQANQVAPFNAFVALGWLQEKLEIPGRANLLLVRARDSMRPETANSTLRRYWQLADAELELRENPLAGAMELRTSRVFLDAPAAEAAFRAATNAAGIFTYFVNELRVGERTTPYSMVTAMGSPVVPADLRDDEILINQWLADDLQAKPGDELKLTYYVVGTMRKLEERSTQFRVRGVLPLAGAVADRDLMPDFPGLAKAENCRDWDAGFPIDTSKIREQDQKYWDNHRGTPKAFVTLAAGQKMWANRFGNLTAVRYPLAEGALSSASQTALADNPDKPISATSAQREVLEKALLANLDPGSVGLTFQPVREQALAAVNQAQDFGQLFLGFSFFLIVAALLLMGLLFRFGIEQRTTEIGTLLALGFRPSRVRLMLLGEGGALAAIGGLLGVVGGVCYARAMLHGLTTIWREAVGTTALHFYAETSTLVVGAVASTLVALLTIWLTLRKQAKRPARELLGGEVELATDTRADELASGSADFSPLHRTITETGRTKVRAPGRSSRGRGQWVAICAGLLALGTMVYGGARRDAGAASAFFGAGALLLIAALGCCAALLWRLKNSNAAAKLSLSGMGVRNATRRRQRSLATLGLLACGSFLVVAVGANRLDAIRDAEKSSSGTGGFALLGESALPVHQDLNSKEGRETYGLDDKALANAQVVPLRVREGDDASCLNLNRAQKPRLLGVRPESLAERRAFTFAKVASGLSKESPWLLLNQQLPGDAVPAIGDDASIQWALGRKVGDTLDYTDERGRPFKVKLVGSLANSILQGSLLISEEELTRRFPNEAGYRMFLIDAPFKVATDVSAVLTRALKDLGLELIPTTRRLAEFNAVQNTYLSTFQILGGLGLLLGSVGLGVVVLRNVMERRSELAVLLAVGFKPRALKWLVLSEHGALLLLGLAAGVGAAVVAVLPALSSPGANVPYASLALTLGAVLVNGLLWTWLATWAALRGKIIEALRNN